MFWPDWTDSVPGPPVDDHCPSLYVFVYVCATVNVFASFCFDVSGMTSQIPRLSELMLG